MSEKPLSPSLNPLCAKLGAYVQKVREARGLKVETVAKQLGIAAGAYPLLEQGRLIPASWLQERIKRWMWEGVSFEGHRHPSTYHADGLNKGWQHLKVMLPPKLRTRLRNEAARIGLTTEELITIAVERFLDSPVVLSTIKLAAESIRKAQMVEMLKSYPDLRAILEGDVELACKVGGPEVAPAPPESVGLEAIVNEIEEKTLPQKDSEEPEEEFKEYEELT